MWNWLLHDPIWVGNSIMSRGNLIVMVLESLACVSVIVGAVWLVVRAFHWRI